MNQALIHPPLSCRLLKKAIPLAESPKAPVCPSVRASGSKKTVKQFVPAHCLHQRESLRLEESPSSVKQFKIPNSKFQIIPSPP